MAVKYLDFNIRFVVLLKYLSVYFNTHNFCKLSFLLVHQKLFQLINKINLLKHHTVSSTERVNDHDDTFKVDKVTCQNRLFLSVSFQLSFFLLVSIARIMLPDHIMHLWRNPINILLK